MGRKVTLPAVGYRSHMLVVVGPFEKRTDRWYAKCQCDCGKFVWVPLKYLQGQVNQKQSCGCVRYKRSSLEYKYGPYAKTLMHKLNGMKGRCYDFNSSNYKNYGGRGIVVCDEWRKDTEAFVVWGLAQGYKPGLSIERIDNDGPYSPDNCCWANDLTQANNRRCNVRVNINGEIKTVTQWSNDPRCQVDYKLLRRRLEDGWDPVRAISTPRVTQSKLEHGMTGTPLHRIWQAAKSTGMLSLEWQKFQAFYDWAIKQGYVQEQNLYRHDVTKAFFPGNCAFGTMVHVNRHSLNARQLTHEGETKSMAQWAEDPRCVVNYTVLNRRISSLGWDDERAIMEPLDTSKSNTKGFILQEAIVNVLEVSEGEVSIVELLPIVQQMGWITKSKKRQVALQSTLTVMKKEGLFRASDVAGILSERSLD